MASKLGNITFDCADPKALSDFWAAVFGYPHAEWPPELKAELLASGLTEENLASRGVAEDPTGEGPRFFFQRVPGKHPTASELETEKDRIVALGATVVVDYDQPWGSVTDHHIVMQDPEGNEFCVQ